MMSFEIYGHKVIGLEHAIDLEKSIKFHYEIDKEININAKVDGSIYDGIFDYFDTLIEENIVYHKNFIIINDYNFDGNQIIQNENLRFMYKINNRFFYEVDDEILFYLKLKYSDLLKESLWDYQSEYKVEKIA